MALIHVMDPVQIIHHFMHCLKRIAGNAGVSAFYIPSLPHLDLWKQFW
ncbi:putative uncharacterized protein [Parachlamydia acanthamoebae UV-7]|uniref:Uncharacterized protein n=2 Tax=Parachlamydia acanthamoebae TaxID=83552 RepID=F8L0U2_PARAV|nr:hypothetical protein [Parachlamydia acanthamoebae]KIA77429.1 hypothetical protein DB43_GG00080 [Parachlamydia acanthamoebae]CCB86844.1 putative uncharacterized protein [Parachlamydia acanthamoebae UV-7]